MTAYSRVKQYRDRLRELIHQPNRTTQDDSELSGTAIALRRAHDEWFEEEVHGWTQLPMTELLNANWNQVEAWCEANVADNDWMIYLPKAAPRAVYFRKPGDAVLIKMTFG